MSAPPKLTSDEQYDALGRCADPDERQGVAHFSKGWRIPSAGPSRVGWLHAAQVRHERQRAILARALADGAGVPTPNLSTDQLAKVVYILHAEYHAEDKERFFRAKAGAEGFAQGEPIPSRLDQAQRQGWIRAHEAYTKGGQS